MPIAALLPIVLSLAPELVRWIAGDRAGDVARQVGQVVQSVTGSDDADAVQAAIEDPAKATELRLALARIVADQESARRQADLDEMRAVLADTASAREHTVELVRSGSPMAWGAAIVSILVLVAFGVVTWLVMTRALPPGSQDIALYTVGALQAMAGGVVSYWVGSSAGSARKDDLLRSTPPRPLARGTP